ncbi:type II toxin-antitoxin system prevent-host-death family antitoxin [Pseudonocardia sp.]|uniref:type II toxin-antitoxin system Phd/YefM family antitoxin n=1 Tax=Pseudonocardia sp. TaxID=60912 RepID=UPI0026179D14|nr:type II toxin-antitoxin system prevent-host-death family antitoxin [Pseudonocardia sp.]
MTVQVDVRDAAELLSHLLARTEAGEDVVITRDGIPIARLTPVETPRPVGFVRGAVTDDFAEPLPPDELELWQG